MSPEWKQVLNCNLSVLLIDCGQDQLIVIIEHIDFRSCGGLCAEKLYAVYVEAQVHV